MFRYTANNNSKPRVAINLKKAYSVLHPQNDGDIAAYDSQTRESMYYGKVDTSGNAVYLITEDGASLAHFDSSNVGVFSINFVVRAFEKMREHYIDLLADNKLDELPYIGRMIPAASWIDFQEIEKNHLGSLQSFFVGNYASYYRDKIDSFDDFLRYFIQFVSTAATEFPVTKTGIMLSHVTPPHSTGLYIDLTEEDTTNDESKEIILESNSYMEYARLASIYGFKVDKYIPWRIRADLGSWNMHQYMKRSGVTFRAPGVGDYFQQFYTRTHYHDLDDLRNFLLQCWRLFLYRFPRKKIYSVQGGKTITLSAIRESNSKTINNIEVWMRILLRVRMEESLVAMTENKFEDIIKKAVFSYEKYGIEKGLNIINKNLKNRYFSVDSASKNMLNYLNNATFRNLKLPLRVKS